MTINGQLIAESRKRKRISQRELSQNMPTSREAIAKYETNARPVPKELKPFFAHSLDDAHFILEMSNDITGGATIPYLDGEKVEHHYASLTFLAIKELREAKEHLKEINISKPLPFMAEHEVDHIKRTIRELLDSIAASQTLVIDLMQHFDLSYVNEVKQWKSSLMARGYLKRRNL
ncbi:helix-turn-helix transcriptional regulator [Halalkalibacter sp. APA_J-10(15)]|uniref:helix-turn-helix domain-containing protein n=1 Tax=Halalkalibacter sp. APA_J-10(15) TaxID=2933805 RepID=UPI001FF634B5|nr:helix-turn-helix transcriptional regulator [Halalkalibacter sp. APA_J-10(15)]MCK0471430.1 helix-turn-helix domain-containing protein [Halalkalibacter sp. APA_J-10(15)]